MENNNEKPLYYGEGNIIKQPQQSKFVSAVEEFIKRPRAGISVLLLFLIFSLAGGVLINGLFSGLSFFLLFMLVYAVYVFVSFDYSYRFTTVSKILLPVTAFLFLSFAFNRNTLTNVITFLTAVTVTLILLIDQSGFDVHSLQKMSIIKDILRLYIEKPLSVRSSPFKAVASRIKKGEKMSAFGLVLIGIVCTVPFAVVLIMLFSSADEMFKNTFQAVIELFSFKNADKILFSLIFGFFACVISSAVFFTLCAAEDDDLKNSKEFIGKINSIVVSSFLAVLILIEAFFSYIQVRFLFLGKLPDNTGYAEYARSGFFQIAAATVITIVIILAVSVFVKRNDDNDIPKTVKILLTVFSSCAVLLFASAYFRMFMYMKNFGLSVKRVLVCWLMALMLTVLIGIVVKLWKSETALFGWIMWSVVAFVIILNVMRVDTLVAKFNVDRYLKNPTKVMVDVDYIGTLSSEAVPQLERLFGTPMEKNAEKAMAYFADDDIYSKRGTHIFDFNIGDYIARRIYKTRTGNVSEEEYKEYWDKFFYCGGDEYYDGSTDYSQNEVYEELSQNLVP